MEIVSKWLDQKVGSIKFPQISTVIINISIHIREQRTKSQFEDFNFLANFVIINCT